MLYFRLFQKAQKNKELMQNEIQERHSFTKEITTLKNLFQRTTISFQNMELQDCPEKAEQLEVSKEWTSECGWYRSEILDPKLLKVIPWLVSREPRKGEYAHRLCGMVWADPQETHRGPTGDLQETHRRSTGYPQEIHRRPTWLEQREQSWDQVGNRPVWTKQPLFNYISSVYDEQGLWLLLYSMLNCSL